jgi:hypothetical protein
VDVHVLARLDGGRRDADRDPVFRDWRTGPDRQEGNLVPKRDVVGGSGPYARVILEYDALDSFTGPNWLGGYSHAVTQCVNEEFGTHVFGSSVVMMAAGGTSKPT